LRRQFEGEKGRRGVHTIPSAGDGAKLHNLMQSMQTQGNAGQARREEAFDYRRPMLGSDVSTAIDSRSARILT
jgi:hypothetical protein